jgi:hypothetical protein
MTTLELPRLGYTLSIMRRRTCSRLTTLPFPLRWVLTLALILNGAAAPPPARAALPDAQTGNAAHAMSAHCAGHHGMLSSKQTTIRRHSECPCCADGVPCHCGCVVALALPMTFPDLRPLAPQTLVDDPRMPDLVAVPRHRLLRPPIV